MRESRSRRGPSPTIRWALVWMGLLWGTAAWAGSVDTGFIQHPWPRQTVRTLEVGRHEVLWRQRASREDGIFAGVRFTAPRERRQVWDRMNGFSDVGRMTPGVQAVRILEETPNRQVIQVDVKVLWKALQLTFEVEQDPPNALRFRLVHEALGEYRGVCWLEDPPQQEAGAGQVAATVVELATWLKPPRPVPMRLVLWVERITFLPAVESFLDSLESHPSVL